MYACFPGLHRQYGKKVNLLKQFVLQTDMLQFCVVVVPPTLYLGVTLVLSESSGCSSACGRLYFLMLQLPPFTIWLKSLYCCHPL